FEVLDADGPIDMPGRHLARGDAQLDRSRPGTRLVKGLQRHRRDGIRPMARVAFVLENWRDVLGRRHRLIGPGVGGRGPEENKEAHESASCEGTLSSRNRGRRILPRFTGRKAGKTGGAGKSPAVHFTSSPS